MSEQDEAQRQALHERFYAIWRSPPGLASLSAVNHTSVGQRYVFTGFLFFLAGGLLAMLMRAQLAFPEGQSVDYETYNRLFTMHGTTMMFLFAVPMLEGIAVYLIPKMIGARDLPFPRLGAYTYWCYLFGGILLYSSFLFDAAPNSGWFMYVPLSSKPYSMGLNADFWLLGITFVEIGAVLAAVELITAILKTRAPGMSLNRMPLFAWTMLVVAFMIVFGFPPLILGSILLELERAFGLPFYDTSRGGDPLLWQHLFWLFGHPEVYIIFLPATGMISMILPTFARIPIVGYVWIVLALLATGFFSFGLWVHHMFATGIPILALSFFSAASMAVAVPSGIQIFAWIATLWRGRPIVSVPMLFILGFFFIFVLGGLTGVMVAVVPFDWQVHGTHFVVAHFHYVLIGGMVFPLFAGLYYWLPLFSGRRMSPLLGRLAFWLLFIGFNVTFLPMHLTGLVGMPRRVYTYPEGLGWEYLNLTSTVGGFILTAGVVVFVIDVILHLRHGEPSGGNPWGAGSLEWGIKSPVPPYNFVSQPHVDSRDPLWQQADLGARLADGEGYLADPGSGFRETLATGIVDGRPEQVLRLPISTWVPLVAALATGVFFIGLLAQVYAVAALGLVLTVIVFVIWGWDTDKHPRMEMRVGRGLTLPTRGPTRESPSWWALVIGLLADAAIFFSLVFAHFFLWTLSETWPPVGLPPPDLALPALALLPLVGSSLAVAWASLHPDTGNFQRGLLASMGLALAFTALEVWSLWHWSAGAREHAYAATVYTIVGLHLVHVAAALLFAAFTLGRARLRYIDAERRLGADLNALFWHYTVGLGIVSFLSVHLFPYLT